jgi:hypothetical protein
MGVRMLAIYGVPLGLLAAGGLIEHIGFVATVSLYCLMGIALTLLIALHWRADLWPRDAPANAAVNPPPLTNARRAGYIGRVGE